MTISDFFCAASPTTLASLLADLDQMSSLSAGMAELKARAESELVANVGDEEAADLIAAACDCEPVTAMRRDGRAC